MDPNNVTIIGIDGGATEAKGHQIVFQNGRFSLSEINASEKYNQPKDFVAITTQLAERSSGDIKLTDEEKKCGLIIVTAFFRIIQKIWEGTGKKDLIIGIGMPGLKTDDGRGINAMNNGPRIPNFLSMLEAMIKEAGIILASPIVRLGSDADYCGIGEEYAKDGSFNGVENVYYMGCGTGVADAMKINGKLMPFDGTKDWIQKAWQIMSPLGVTFEKVISARSMNEIFHRAANKSDYPENDNCLIACTVMTLTAMNIAELLFERIFTLKNGRENKPWRGDNYMALNPNHPYCGKFFDRLIIGQRIANLPGIKKLTEDFLQELILGSGDKGMIESYTVDKKLRTDLIVLSPLRAAPALGAAIAACQAAEII